MRRATERTIVAGSPQRCYEVVADLERYPEWAADIKEVKVLERDAEGRPSLAAFRAAAFGRSTSYTLRYDHSKAPGQLSWVQADGDLTRRLDGAYVFEPAGEGHTEVSYHLDVELAVPLPGFVKRRAESRIVHTALDELKARVESG
ncbi:MAG TPA: SRPBCC family protein [Acidimicrobiales bacterium]|nr:SRPBCC family protein [Acidimicrobiales bacterium]